MESIMDKVTWTQQMELGIAPLDEAHRALVNAMTELADLPDAQFGAGFAAFVAALEEDFRSEEEAMENIEFPALRSHREQHARVLGALHQVVPGLTQGDFETARRAVALLPHWFMLHLATQDAALAAAMELAAPDSAAAGPAL
jgi:hemerythrin-like metal-binding protein